MKTTFKINNKTVDPPVNKGDLVFEVNFDKEDPNSKGALSTPKWDFVSDGAKAIIAHRNGGLFGGPGIYEGLPIDVFLKDDVSTANIYKGYLDISQEDTVFECDRVKNIASRVRGGTDWMSDHANTVFYWRLFELNELTIADEVQVPYTITSIPNYKDVAIASLTAFVVIGAIRDSIKEISKVIADIVGVTNIAAGIIKLIILILHFIVLIISLIKLIIDIKRSLIQPVKYHTGMRLQRLLEAGAEHLNMKFTSPIFDDKFYRDTVIMPAKNQPFDNKDGPKKVSSLRGNLSPSSLQRAYFDGSFGDLLRICKDMFNAKLVIKDNVIKMVRVDVNTSKVSFKMPDVKIRAHGTNAFEIKAEYTISFKTDLKDENTLDEFKGTIVQIVTEPKKITNHDMVLTRGSKKVPIPFALAKIKLFLNSIEKFFNTFDKVFVGIANFLLKILNVAINLANKVIALLMKIINILEFIGINVPFVVPLIPNLPLIESTFSEDRLFTMKLTSDFFTEPKIFTLPSLIIFAN